MFNPDKEFKWIQALKKAAKKRGLKQISDIEYLQSAIETKGETSKAIALIENRRKNSVDASLPDGDKKDALNAIDKCRSLFPSIIGSKSKAERLQNAKSLALLDTPVFINAMTAVVKVFDPRRTNDLIKVQRIATEKKVEKEESEEFKQKKQVFEPELD